MIPIYQGENKNMYEFKFSLKDFKNHKHTYTEMGFEWFELEADMYKIVLNVEKIDIKLADEPEKAAWYAEYKRNCDRKSSF